MGEPSSHIGDFDVRQELIDVNRIPLDQLISSDDSVLSTAIRRLVNDVRKPSEGYSAFGNIP